MAEACAKYNAIQVQTLLEIADGAGFPRRRFRWILRAGLGMLDPAMGIIPGSMSASVWSVMKLRPKQSAIMLRCPTSAPALRYSS